LNKRMKFFVAFVRFVVRAFSEGEPTIRGCRCLARRDRSMARRFS
jgi:hypothetical protein